MKINSILLVLFLFPLFLPAQNQSDYYINWNVDYTERLVKPSIPISRQEAATVNCYQVSFDEENRFAEVKYFFAGKPSPYASYGAYRMVRNYFPNRFEDTFRNEKNEAVENREGAFKIVYHLNEQGYWIKKEHFNRKGELVDVKGPHAKAAAISLVTRDAENRLATELRLSTERDTVPDINGFPLVHFGFNEDGYISYRKLVDGEGNLENGPLGYAQVNFQCEANGNFYEEEFRDENYRLTTHPILLFARVNFRQFNPYGKYQFIYYMDEKGYPDADRAWAKMEYNANLSLIKGTFYDREGKKTEDARGIAESRFTYASDGKPLGRVNYNLQGEQLD